jgi:hypothetical protein
LGGVPWLFSSDRYSDRFYGGKKKHPKLRSYTFQDM